MDEFFFPTYYFSVLKSDQLYIIAKYPEVLCKKGVLKSCKIHRKTPVSESLFKWSGSLKRHSDTGVFLWILQKF